MMTEARMIGIHLTAAANNTAHSKTNKKRGLGFRGSALFSKKEVIDTSYRSIKTNSADYIKYVCGTVRSWCNKPVEINVESGRLADIAASDESCIFIMNHTSKQPKDFDNAMFFNTLLYREYIYRNKAEKCPRSRILTNKHILEEQADGGEKLKWMGLVPINAGFNNKGKSENAVILKNLINEIAAAKTNLFIFPEGALGIFSFLPMQYKFQPGVSSIVKKVLDIIDKIKVVPLGFAHNSKDSAIHIGEPVNFQKKDGMYTASRGNADSKFFNNRLHKLYQDNDEIILTKKGEPLQGKKVIPYISGILVENLMACAREARSDLAESAERIYTI